MLTTQPKDFVKNFFGTFLGSIFPTFWKKFSTDVTGCKRKQIYGFSEAKKRLGNQLRKLLNFLFHFALPEPFQKHTDFCFKSLIPLCLLNSAMFLSNMVLPGLACVTLSQSPLRPRSS